MVWYSHLFQNFPQFVVIHTIKVFGIVNKAEVDVVLELSCFFDDPTDVSNLISGSSAFSKSSLKIWKFSVHLLLKPSLDNFEHDWKVAYGKNECRSSYLKILHILRGFPGGPVVKTLHFHCRGQGFNPWSRK